MCSVQGKWHKGETVRNNYFALDLGCQKHLSEVRRHWLKKKKKSKGNKQCLVNTYSKQGALAGTRDTAETCGYPFLLILGE